MKRLQAEVSALNSRIAECGHALEREPTLKANLAAAEEARDVARGVVSALETQAAVTMNAVSQHSGAVCAILRKYRVELGQLREAVLALKTGGESALQTSLGHLNRLQTTQRRVLADGLRRDSNLAEQTARCQRLEAEVEATTRGMQAIQAKLDASQDIAVALREKLASHTTVAQEVELLRLREAAGKSAISQMQEQLSTSEARRRELEVELGQVRGDLSVVAQELVAAKTLHVEGEERLKLCSDQLKQVS